MSKYSEYKNDEFQTKINKNLRKVEQRVLNKLVYSAIIVLLIICIFEVLIELTLPSKQVVDQLVWHWITAMFVLGATSFLFEIYLNGFKELNSNECERAYYLVSNVKECEEYRNTIVKIPRTVRYMDLVLMEEMAGFYRHTGNEAAYEQVHSKEDLYVKE